MAETDYNKIRDYRDKLVRNWTELLNEDIAWEMAEDAYEFFLSAGAAAGGESRAQ
jgi:hypothetical protein